MEELPWRCTRQGFRAQFKSQPTNNYFLSQKPQEPEKRQPGTGRQKSGGWNWTAWVWIKLMLTKPLSSYCYLPFVMQGSGTLILFHQLVLFQTVKRWLWWFLNMPRKGVEILVAWKSKIKENKQVECFCLWLTEISGPSMLFANLSLCMPAHPVSPSSKLLWEDSMECRMEGGYRSTLACHLV